MTWVIHILITCESYNKVSRHGVIYCLRYGISVWQHIGQKYHCFKQAPSRYDLCLKATLNTNEIMAR